MTVQVIQGDCRDVLPTLPTASVDVVITDPPYGDTALDWDKRVAGWLPLLPRVMKPSASLWCFGSMRFFLERAPDFADWTYAQDIVWEKHNGSNSLADRFRRVHELVVQFYPRGVKWADVFKSVQTTPDAIARTVRRKQKAQHWSKIKGHHFTSIDGGPRLMRSVISHRSEHGRAEHPTQKPVGILLPLIEYSCPPQGLILDPFAGSGTTGIAARVADRSAVLIEANLDYVALARRRISNDAPLFEVASP